VVAKTIAFCPIIDIFFDPFLKSFKITGFEPVRKFWAPERYNKRLFSKIRSIQFFAELKDISFLKCFNFFPVFIGYLTNQACFYAIAFYLFFKISLKALFYCLIRNVSSLLRHLSAKITVHPHRYPAGVG